MKDFGPPLFLHFRKFSMAQTMLSIPMSLQHRVHRHLEVELPRYLSAVYRHHRDHLVRALILQGPLP